MSGVDCIAQRSLCAGRHFAAAVNLLHSAPAPNALRMVTSAVYVEICGSLPPRLVVEFLGLDLSTSGLLCGLGWFVTKFFGRHIPPVIKMSSYKQILDIVGTEYHLVIWSSG